MKKYATHWRRLASLSLALQALCASTAWACEGPSHQTFSSAYALIQAGSLGAARTQLESLFSPKFSQPEVLNNLAAIAQLKGDSAQALAWLNQATTLKPPYASIRNNLALSKQQPANWTPLQLISSLPCKPVQYTAMTLAEGMAYVAPPRKIPDYDTDVLSGLTLQSDSYQEPFQDEMQDYWAQTDVQSASLSLAVGAWAASWRRQLPKEYLSYYASDFNFADTGASSRTQWERLRTQRLTQYKSIELELSDLQLLALASDLVQVSFHQRWRANAQTTRESKKTMTWQFQQDQWMILAEHAKDLPKPQR